MFPGHFQQYLDFLLDCRKKAMLRAKPQRGSATALSEPRKGTDLICRGSLFADISQLPRRYPALCSLRMRPATVLTLRADKLGRRPNPARAPLITARSGNY